MRLVSNAWRFAVAVGCIVFIMAGQPAAAQQSNGITSDPGLLTAPKPAGAVSSQRLRQVLQQLGNLPDPFRALIPTEQEAFELARSASNNWTVSKTLTLLNRTVTVNATVSVAPDDGQGGQDPSAQAAQPLLRFDGTLSAGSDFGAGLRLKDGSLTFAVAVDGASQGGFYGGTPQFRMATEFKTNFSFNNAALSADITLPVDPQTSGFQLSAADARLGQLFPMLANMPKLKDIAFDNLWMNGDGISGEFKAGDQKMMLSRTTSPYVTGASYRMSGEGGDGMLVADVVPGADLVPVLSTIRVNEFSLSDRQLHVEGNYQGRSIVIDAAPGSLSLVAGMTLSQMLPKLAGIPFADQAAFSSLSVTGDKAVFNGSYAGKTVAVTRTRGNDATLDIATAGLTMGDFISEAQSSGLTQFVELDEVVVADDHVAVDLKINQQPAEIYIERGRSWDSRVAFFYFDALDPATLIPNSSGSGLSGVGLRKALFAYSRGNRSIGQGDLPGDLGSKVTLPAGTTMAVSQGSVALSGNFDVSSAKTLTDILSAVSISQTSFPVNGSFAADTIQFLASNAAVAANNLQYQSGTTKAQLLSRLNLNVSMSVPRVPGLDAYVSPSGPFSLAIKGKNDYRDPRVLLSGSFPVAMTVDGSSLDLLAEIDLDKALASKGSTGDITIKLDQPWNQPFGVPGIVVNTGSFTIDLSNKSVSDLSLQGSATFAGQNNIGVTANFARTNDSLAFQYFEFDASQGFKLSGLPGFSSIPHADQFTVDTIKLAPSGITAKTMLNKVHVDTFIFKDPSGGAVFAVDQQGLRLTDIFGGLANTPLKDLTLGNAAIVVSENGLSGDPKTISSTAQDLFKDIFGTSGTALALPAGVALLSKIDFSQSGATSKALQKLGVDADAAIVMGGVSGLFGSGSPSLSLTVMMDRVGQASGMPKNVMNYKAGHQPGVFINWAGDDVEIGVRTAMMVKAGSDELEFDASIDVAFSGEDIGLNITGGMDGTWNKPFGIQPLTISNVTITTGIDALGNVDLGFKGSQTFGKESLSIATNMKFALEAEGLPDAVAFSGDADTLGYGALLEIAQAAVGGKLDLDKIQLPTFDIKNAHFAFATPGATEPQLGLISEGVAFSGTFSFLGQDLGSVNGSAGTSGLKLGGALTDFTLGPISLKNNTVDIQISLQPKATLTSDIKVIGAEQTVLVDLAPPTLDFDVVENLGPFGNGTLNVVMTGVDLKNGGFDQNADISFTGHFKDDLVPHMIQLMRDGSKALREAADGKLDDDKKALQDAQAKVGDLDQKVADARKQADQAKQSAEAKVQAAQARVDSLQNEINKDQNEANTCGNRLTHGFCKPYWEIRKAGAEAAKAVATGVLDAAKVAINVAYDLDPTVLALEAERDTERLGLSIALAVVEGSEEVVNAITGPFEQGLEQVLNSLPFTIQEVTFAGDLKRMVANDEPLLLDMSYTLLQQQRRDYLAFKLKDWDFNVKSFAVLPALVAGQVVTNISGKISPKAADWLNSHIGTELAAASDEVRDEVLKAEARFENTLKGMETNTAPFQPAVDRLSQQRQQTASELGSTDFLGPSQQFSLTYLAVGHSALCLAVASDGTTVHQDDCKDNGTEQWRTQAVDDYVQLVANGLCLQAQTDKASVAQQGVLLMLRSCDASDKTEHWKVTTYDGIYSQIINRASQKCLHFDSENARPQTAKAVWTSCIGMDSQNFRAIPDAERPDFVPKGSRLASAANTCVWQQQLSATFIAFQTGSCGADFLQSMQAQFGKLQQSIFDYVEMVDGSLRLVYRATPSADAKTEMNDGLCFFSNGMTGTFNTVPCNRASGVTYDVLEVQQHFMLRQQGTNLCVEVGNIQRDANTTSIGPFLMTCNNQKPEQLLRWESPLAPA